MIDRIARLGKETALYGLSTVLGRMVNFILVPLYAHYLLPEENGIIATLYSYVAFVVVVYGMGMEQAFMRHWVDADEEGRGVVFRTAMVGSLAGAVLSVIGIFFRDEVAALAGFGPAESKLIGLAAAILALDNFAVVPFAFLRMERRALHFAILKIIGIVGTVLLTIVLVVYGGQGAEGVFAANAMASAIVLMILAGVVRGAFRKGRAGHWLSGRQLLDLLRFGVPLVPAGLAGIALQVIDRPIIRALTDDATVGLYQLNARLAIFMMLAVGMFDFAWRPFFLQHAKDADAKQLFSRVFTFFSVLLLAIFLTVSLFIEELVRFPISGTTFFPEFYWQGTSIVPVILASNMFTGAYVVFLTGVYLEKRTGIVPVISGVAAAVSVVGIVFLVPSMGIMGAALSALAGHTVQTTWMYFVGQRLFRVRYAWKNILALVTITGALYAGVQLLAPEPWSAVAIVVKAGAVCLFIWSVFLTRIVTPKGAREVLSLRSRDRE